MFKKILRVRYMAFIINIFVTINTIVLISIGILKTFNTLSNLFTHGLNDLKEKDHRPGLEIAEALDIFLIALVFLVFVIGINVLFIRHSDKDYINSIPKWMRVKSFSHLKFLLMEAIIATSFIIFLSTFIRYYESLNWKFLTLPISILLLAVSLKVLRFKEDNG